jgi:hypothetical protein
VFGDPPWPMGPPCTLGSVGASSKPLHTFTPQATYWWLSWLWYFVMFRSLFMYTLWHYFKLGYDWYLHISPICYLLITLLFSTIWSEIFKP